MSTVLSESMRRSGLLFGSQADQVMANTETIQLTQPDLEQRPGNPLPAIDSPVMQTVVHANEAECVRHIGDNENLDVDDLDYQQDDQQ